MERRLDSRSRIRAAGVLEMSANKRLSEVQSQSWRCLMELDTAMHKASAAATPEGRPLLTESQLLDTLGSSIWRDAYHSRADVSASHALAYAQYGCLKPPIVG
jgi:hypothetical protein